MVACFPLWDTCTVSSYNMKAIPQGENIHSSQVPALGTLDLGLKVCSVFSSRNLPSFCEVTKSHRKNCMFWESIGFTKEGVESLYQWIMGFSVRQSLLGMSGATPINSQQYDCPSMSWIWTTIDILTWVSSLHTLPELTLCHSFPYPNPTGKELISQEWWHTCEHR